MKASYCCQATHMHMRAQFSTAYTAPSMPTYKNLASKLIQSKQVTASIAMQLTTRRADTEA